MADANFDETTFSGDARFGGATFTGDARFEGATFTGDAWFEGATFSPDAWFTKATFSRHAWFTKASFSGDARFGGATFSRGRDSLSFGQSRIALRDAQHVWPPGWRLGPDGNGGYTVVRANDGLDTGLKPDAPPAAGMAGGA